VTTCRRRWILGGVERRTRTPSTGRGALPLDEFGGAGALLTPYVPRFQIAWLRESPEALHRSVDGSLAFVDISGFTALTEQLARRGRIGSELMRDTLDTVFGALLDEAYDWGAGLLKWGGDALLLLFDGPQHEARAARAAWEMQRVLARVGRIGAGSSVVALRMSVGIASGPIDFFLAGSVHRELFLAGPTVTETVTIEAAANADEIGIGASLAAALPAACVGRGPEPGSFRVVAPPEVERGRAPDVGHFRGSDAASCIPAALRRHVLLAAAEPEHRTITAAFLELMDTDLLLAQLGPDAFALALDERVRGIQEAALRYDVPVYQADIGKGSVKVVLTGGAPATTGRDEEQVLRMLRDVIDAPGLIPLRAGVNTGRVFAGDFGPPYRRTFAVFGDAINTAARVSARAERGQILATEIVLERSHALFETTPVEPFKAKGKAKPVRAAAVGPVTGTREGRAVETPLVGRERELAALRALCADAAAGRGFAVEISATRGLGKSRLAAELRADPALRVLEARCEEYESGTPYYALRQLVGAALELGRGVRPAAAEQRLREVVARVDPALEAWIPLLGILLGLELEATPETATLDERFLRETLATVLGGFLDAVHADAPAVLVVEDAQFVDDASADLLRRLVGPGGFERHGLVVTHADPARMWLPLEDVALPALAFTLLPLAEQDAVAILELATDDQPLRPHEIEELARRSGGSPLFLFELLDLARRGGSVEALPDSVEAVVTAEIDRLDPVDRTLLRYASVLGVRVDPSLLDAALDGATGVDGSDLDHLRGLLDPDPAGALRFRTTLVRDTAYEGLAFRRRRELHERVGDAIEARAVHPDEDAPALARHFLQAQRYDKAWRYARVAGDRARAVGAHVEAGRFYEAALEAAQRVRGIEREERARAWVALGAVRETAGLFDESFDALRRATTLLHDDPVERARVFALRTRARVRRGAYGLALRETSSGLRVVDTLTTRDAKAARATLRAMRSEVRWLQGHPREAILLAEQAINEAGPAEELEALARAYTALDGAYQMLGRPEKAIHERMSLDIYTTLGDTRSRGIMELNLGVQAYADGRWDEAAALYSAAQEDCTRAGDRQHTAVAGANLGELLISLGRLDEAAAVLTDARRVLRSSGFTPFALFAETQLARCLLERGKTDAAVEALAALVDEAAGMGHAGIVLEITLYHAQALARAGSGALALEFLNAAAFTAGEDAVFLAAPLERARAACLAAQGRLDDAREFLERALRAAQEQGLIYEQLLAHRDLLALSGAPPRAEELRETERLADLLGLPA
jgi:class 3 adenylate cyclase/tetratricopeptide (TPR) repeat protein